MHHIKYTSADGHKNHFTYAAAQIKWVFVLIKSLRTNNVTFTHYFEE
jgi:hypothetical protein